MFPSTNRLAMLRKKIKKEEKKRKKKNLKD